MSAFLYYIIIYPLSRLSFSALYRISDFIFWVMYYLTPYRKKVVFENLTRSFPNKSSDEIKSIAKKFYQHFCDLTLESIKMFSISKDEISQHVIFNDMTVFHKLYAEGKSVVFGGGHYNNWEMFGVAVQLGIPHKCLALYHPLSNKWFDKKMKESRGQFGLNMWSTKLSKEMFETEKGNITLSVFGMDQSPSSANRCHWMTFLNQDTGVSYGVEKFAKDYNLPVIYGRINKIKRGYYSLDVELVTGEPTTWPKGAIVEKLTQLLETDINNIPEYWLWTHRRWKKKKPEIITQ